jgi:hypothetical protein
MDIQNRTDKIKFLKGLSEGSRNVNELLTGTFEIFTKEGPDEPYRISRTDKEFTAEELNAYHKSRPRSTFIILTCAVGCAPICDLKNPREQDIIWKEQKTYE